MTKKVYISIFLIFIILAVIAFCFVFYSLAPKSTEDNIKRVEKYTENLVRKVEKDGLYYWNAESYSDDWLYFNGFMMYALIQSSDKYNNFIEKFYDKNILPNGRVDAYRKSEVDSVLPARTLFYLDKQKYKSTIDYVYNQIKNHETMPHIGNNYIHKINNSRWERYPFALDGLYMALPFLAEYGDFDDIYNRMIWVSDNLKDENGLYNHGTDKKGKRNKIVWLRGVGWYAMAQVDIIERMPEGKEKEELTKRLIIFFDNMLRYRDSKSKMWYNVVNPKEKLKNNKLETSGSAMLSYAMLKACNRGIVSDKYCNAGIETFNGIVNRNLKFNTLKDIYASANVKEFEVDYCKDYHYLENEAKGIAPLILAAHEASIHHHKTQTQDAQ